MRTCRLLPLLVLSIVAGCTRTHVSAVSPDGRWVALVLDRRTIDPPTQSLWLGARGTAPRLIMRLGPDQEWCHTVVWSADSSTVAFLVQDTRLVVVDARTTRTVFDRWLVEHRDYPTRELARRLALSADGEAASFEICPRRGGPCRGERVVRIRPSVKATDGGERP